MIVCSAQYLMVNDHITGLCLLYFYHYFIVYSLYLLQNVVNQYAILTLALHLVFSVFLLIASCSLVFDLISCFVHHGPSAYTESLLCCQ